MAVFTVKVPEGELSKAIRQISAWDGKTRLRVEAALKRGTNAVYREARQRVPIRSGKLKKSIRQRFSTVKLEGQVFSNQPYAHLVEFGSRAHTVKPRKKKALRFFRGGPVFTKRARIPAQSGKPFFKPAYDYVEPQLIRDVKKAIQEP